MTLEELLVLDAEVELREPSLEFFVTGCSGFIGTHLVKHLLDEGHLVTGYDLVIPAYTHVNFDFVQGDIIDLERLRASVVKPDGIFHLAAQTKVPDSTQDPSYDFLVNAQGTFNVLSCASEATFVYASTSTVYGIAATPTPEEHAMRPVSFYGASKAAGELYCSAFNGIFGVPTTSLRLFNVYGPGNAKGVMYDLIKKLQLDGSHLEILGSGLQKKDYVYIDDVIDAFLLAYDKGIPGEAYNVGSGRAITVNQIAGSICRILDLHPDMSWTGGKSWEGDIESTQADISCFTSFGWKPKTDLETGLCNLCDWIKS
ncbi:MAG TPA: NAD-dependent epimerase/dehydratase family protein [archaeon]